MLSRIATFCTFAGLLLLPLTALADIGPATPPQPKSVAADWHDGGVGVPATSASHTWVNSTLTLTGIGDGLNSKLPTPKGSPVKLGDQCQYRYFTRKAGDFEVVVRLVDFTGTGTASAGIMVRGDNTPTSLMTALYYAAEKNSVGWMSRVPGASLQLPPTTPSSGIQLAQKPPLWLRMVRIGKNFAVYKSRDGRFWSMISNTSGGAFPLSGPLELGFFVTSPAADGATAPTPATATFDSIAIGPPRMQYKTSWVGNTFGCRGEDNHVSNGLSAMWVASDGTCYTSSYWDEGGQPVTSYRNGRVLRGLGVGTPQTAEGGITGDDKHIYVAAVDKIVELDPAATDFSPRNIHLTVNLLDKTLGMSVIDGMASNGHQLFVADSRDNLIRVVTEDPVATYQVPEAANDGLAAAPGKVIVPEDNPKFAPAEVYQTQRVGEGFRYTIPGMTPGGAYTIRFHLAEYATRPENHRMMQVGTQLLNIFDLAGGILKAYVVDQPGYKADANGNVIMHFSGGYGGGLCGFEVLDAKGARVFAVNCGGPAIGDFKGESEELVNRNFAFDRPGPMTIDKRGNLWIIQRGNDYPIGGGVTAKYTAAVKCYQPDGTPTGRTITDVVNPRALGYDAAKDQLLVGENGPDMNVRIYGGLDATPTLVRTFGQPGGIYSGKHPGLVTDPAAGGSARFVGIAGVGVDKAGNIYVGGGLQGTDLRMFTPDGKLGWMLNSLMFCNTYDFDPASDGADLYGTYNHVKLDLTKTAPGTEQKYVAYNWDVRKYGDADRAGGSQSIVRRLGPDKRLVMFTSGQGIVGDIKIFRYAENIAIPAGSIGGPGGTEVWIDANGDGKKDPDEVTKMASGIGWVTTLCIDSKGDIWAGVPGTGGSWMRHFKFKGFNSVGAPIYGSVKGDGYDDIPFPEEGAKTNAWAMACRLDYNADKDTMVCFYPAVARTGEKDTTPPQYFLARYDNWSKGNRVPKWKIHTLSPYINPDYFMYEVGFYPYSGYEGMNVAGNYVFLAYLFGDIQAFDMNTGKLAQTFPMGPEVDGGSAWEDAAMGLRAFETKAGEYLILDENSGWGGKNNFIRWKP